MAQTPCFKNRLHIIVVFKQIPDVEHTVGQDVGVTYCNIFLYSSLARLHRFHNCIFQIWQGYVMNLQALRYSTSQGEQFTDFYMTIRVQCQTVPRQIVVLSF
jgi:hypothetical protein